MLAPLTTPETEFHIKHGTSCSDPTHSQGHGGQARAQSITIQHAWDPKVNVITQDSCGEPDMTQASRMTRQVLGIEPAGTVFSGPRVRDSRMPIPPMPECPGAKLGSAKNAIVPALRSLHGSAVDKVVHKHSVGVTPGGRDATLAHLLS